MQIDQQAALVLSRRYGCQRTISLTADQQKRKAAAERENAGTTERGGLLNRNCTLTPISQLAQVSAARVRLVLKPLESGGLAPVQPAHVSRPVGVAERSVRDSTPRSAGGTVGIGAVTHWTAQRATSYPYLARSRPIGRLHADSLRKGRLFWTAVGLTP